MTQLVVSTGTRSSRFQNCELGYARLGIYTIYYDNLAYCYSSEAAYQVLFQKEAIEFNTSQASLLSVHAWPQSAWMYAAGHA